MLCLCAISGDTVFLEAQFIDTVTSEVFGVSEALKGMKHLFFEGVEFLNQLNILDGSNLNPLHVSLLSLKCFKMESARHSVQTGVKDCTSFIKKLVSHPVLKEAVQKTSQMV